MADKYLQAPPESTAYKIGRSMEQWADEHPVVTALSPMKGLGQLLQGKVTSKRDGYTTPNPALMDVAPGLKAAAGAKLAMAGVFAPAHKVLSPEKIGGAVRSLAAARGNRAAEEAVWREHGVFFDPNLNRVLAEIPTEQMQYKLPSEIATMQPNSLHTSAHQMDDIIGNQQFKDMVRTNAPEPTSKALLKNMPESSYPHLYGNNKVHLSVSTQPEGAMFKPAVVQRAVEDLAGVSELAKFRQKLQNAGIADPALDDHFPVMTQQLRSGQSSGMSYTPRNFVAASVEMAPNGRVAEHELKRVLDHENTHAALAKNYQPTYDVAKLHDNDPDEWVEYINDPQEVVARAAGRRTGLSAAQARDRYPLLDYDVLPSR